MREVHRHNPRMVILRRRAMATDRPLLTWRAMADILRRDTATDRRRPMGITTPHRTKVRGSTSFAMDAEDPPPAFRRRMGTITAPRRRACRVRTEKGATTRHLAKRVPRTARVPRAAERAVDPQKVMAVLPVVGSRMEAVAAPAAVARRLRRLTAMLIPRITEVGRHRRDIPAEGFPTAVITVGRRPLAIMATRLMAIRLIIRMVGTVHLLLVKVVDRHMTDTTDVVAILGPMTLVVVLAKVLVPIQPSANPLELAQKVVATSQP